MATSPPLEFLAPRLDGRVLALSRRVLPLWLRWRQRVTAMEVDGMEHLVEAMRSFQAGESRLLLAFRHPSLDDPLSMARLLWVELVRAGRRQGLRFDPAPTGQFLFDRGIPLWAGEAMGWLFTRLGGASIQRSKLDLPALRTARKLLLEGPHPFALAPEGATNGHNERLSPLEPGTAQLAFWTAADLAEAGRSERMDLLPIGLQYSFIEPVWGAIEVLLCRLEEGAGLAPDHGHDLDPSRLHGRLVRLGERMLEQMEAFYRDKVRLALPEGCAPDPAFGPRLQRLMDLALRRVEQSFGMQPCGSLTDRCRRLEQAGWDRLYPARPPDAWPGPWPTGWRRRRRPSCGTCAWSSPSLPSAAATCGTGRARSASPTPCCCSGTPSAGSGATRPTTAPGWVCGRCGSASTGRSWWTTASPTTAAIAAGPSRPSRRSCSSGWSG